MSRKIWVMVSIVFAISPALALADELIILKGKGVEVCEEHLKNLDALSLLEMVCTREKYPEDSNIRRPKWDRLDLEGHQPLVKKIERFLEGGDQFAYGIIMDDEKEFKRYLQEVIKSNYLLVAHLDIDNDGKKENICLYSERRCLEPPPAPYARALLVLNADLDLIDVQKTEPLLQNPFSQQLDVKGKAVNHLYQMYDVFSFKGTTFFDKWNAYDRILNVYNLKDGKVKEVCTYKYILHK